MCELVRIMCDVIWKEAVPVKKRPLVTFDSRFSTPATLRWLLEKVRGPFVTTLNLQWHSKVKAMFAHSVDPKTGSSTKWRGNYFVFTDSSVAPPIVPMSFPSAAGADKSPEQLEDEAAADAGKKRKLPPHRASAEVSCPNVTQNDSSSHEVKRKPGRPRKSQLQCGGGGTEAVAPSASAPAAAAAPAATAAAAVVPTAGAGIGARVGAAQSDASALEVKRKRGRPRKTPLQSDMSGAGATAASAPAPAAAAVAAAAAVVAAASAAGFSAPAAAVRCNRRPSAARQMQELVERSKEYAFKNEPIQLRDHDEVQAYGVEDQDYEEDDGRFGDVVDVVADDVEFNPTNKFLVIERNDGCDGAKRLRPMYSLTNYVFEDEVHPPVAKPVVAPVARAFKCNWRSCDLLNRLFKYSRMRYGQNAGMRPNEFVVRFDFVLTSALHTVNAVVAVMRNKRVLGHGPPLYTWKECGMECAKMCFDLCLALRARKLGVSSTLNGKSHFSQLMDLF